MFVYKFQIKLTLSVIIDAILAFFNHPVARKDLKFKRTKQPFALLTDRCANRLKVFDLQRIAAENKYLERENKQIIPSLIDFMTRRFYIVILFTKRFHGSAHFAFQTRSQSVFTE